MFTPGPARSPSSWRAAFDQSRCHGAALCIHDGSRGIPDEFRPTAHALDVAMAHQNAICVENRLFQCPGEHRTHVDNQ
jgi:hypothetical protein